MEVDRRTSLGLIGAGATGLPAAWPAEARQDRPAVVLYDARFGEAAREAAAWAQRGAIAIETRRQDIGNAWRGMIARRLADGGGAVCGVTLYADQMISAAMGRDHGLRLVHLRSDPARDGGATLFRWVLA